MAGRLFSGDTVPMMEFHVSRAARDRYQFAESLFSFSGNVVFANVSGSREFAHRMNQVRDVERNPELAVRAGALYVMGLIDEASHVLLARYRETLDPKVMTDALSWFSGDIGTDALDKVLLTFVQQFPGTAVYRGEQTAQEWLEASSDGTPHRAVALEELVLLWLANRNDAFRPFDELFEDKTLAEQTVYRRIGEQLPAYFATRPLVTMQDSAPITLYDLLRAPALAAPGSLSDQLALIRTKWRPLLGDRLDRLLLMASEVLREEDLAIWAQFHPQTAEERAAAAAAAARRRREHYWPSLVGRGEVPEFGDAVHEYERFSPDVDWMPNAVLIAKSTYVWLAQLSKEYGRPITRLDQIPDEELELLARRGMNSLWLIGIWERSRASQTIKQLCGNPDAVASAYSLFDYRIAEDLGGEAAYINLRDRAYRRGLRLASDMVPNHMGIDSPWVIEHPEWFISRQDTPYPAYKFDGPDLSHDPRAEIKIEDHYYEQSDAAVVFRRRDRASGETRYIYHGNDGTSFPWNDTAQLDYLNPAVREHVIQTILHVARLFPVIRFDAAMTLAKRHFQRLWFPGPGSSGAIPSRAEYGMTTQEFNAHMPHEFWREVVDRVAAEVPGTLLLAEAFWLMEGYFVRTLGMHRVYNSAFMHMMCEEDNAKYRTVLKKTLEFEPDIMKRYVNFMSNPDERTAIDQFGKGDKCFGVAALMATLPGLPMFGHGQVEGFTEKYGMEYRRPRYDETPDPWLVERHDREIAPLLRQRALFAESANFLLYDFFTGNGTVDENVFAYSNRRDGQRGLVIYNNRYSTTRGTIDWSAAYLDKHSGQLRQQRLAEGLELTRDPAIIFAYRDSRTGLEYLHRAETLAERGLSIELHAYQYHVFLNWRELHATADKPWGSLCDFLGGRGVPNLEDALVKLELQPLHDALRIALDPDLIRDFAELSEQPRAAAGSEKSRDLEQNKIALFENQWKTAQDFLREARLARGDRRDSLATAESPRLAEKFRKDLRAAMNIPALESLFPTPWTGEARCVLPSDSPQMTATALWGPVLGWLVLELLGESVDPQHPDRAALGLFDRMRLREPLAQSFAALGFDGEGSWRAAARVRVALLVGAHDSLHKESGKEAVSREDHAPRVKPSGKLPAKNIAPSNEEESGSEGTPVFPPELWQDSDIRWLTGVNESQGYSYFSRESYEQLLWWLQMRTLHRLAGEEVPSRKTISEISKNVTAALAAAASGGYRLETLLQNEDSKAETAETRTSTPTS